jgi:hypothetical protein
MAKASGSCCCVCKASDSRTLVDVSLVGGAKTTLCGSHALLFRRSREVARTPAEVVALLGERRHRRERRSEGDALADSLAAAFAGDRRAADRRRA